MRQRFRWDLAVPIALFLLALFLRVYALPQHPPGLHSDEAYNGVDALDILNGEHAIFFERNTGREPLFIYLQAVSVALLGTTPFALRLVSALVGAATVPAVYWCVKEAFTGTRLPPRRVAGWTALLLALSYWHLNFSRIGYRAIMLPLLAALTCAFFWRAWRKLCAARQTPWVDLLLCGVLLGLAQYTYTAARFLPLLLVALVAAGVLTTEGSLVGLRRAGLALAVIGVASLLVWSPLGLYYLAHPDSFFGRAASVSLLNPVQHEGNLPAALALNLARTAAMFGVLGDPNWRHNPAGRPAFDLLLGAWLAVGLAWAFIRRHSLSHLFGPLWLAVLLLPAWLSDAPPHTLRAIGAVPAACLVAVLGLQETGDWLGCAAQRRFPAQFQKRSSLSSKNTPPVARPRLRDVSALTPFPLREGGWGIRFPSARNLLAHPRIPAALSAWLPLPFLLFSGVLGVYAYFTAFDGNANVDAAFQQRFVALAAYLEDLNLPANMWLVPVYPRTNLPYPDAILGFLSNRRLNSGAILAIEDRAAAGLSELSRIRREVSLLDWPGLGMEPDGAYAVTDWKRLVRFLLLKYGRVQETHAGDEVTYTTYTLAPAADYRVARAVEAQDVSFGATVKLTGLAYGAAGGFDPASVDGRHVPSGESVWAVLRWQAETDIKADLKVSLFLTDEAGHRAGQVDDLLLGDNHLYESTWRAGEPAGTYHILPVLPAVPPGRYRLDLAVYDAETLDFYPAVASSGAVEGTAVVIGEVEITRPLSPAHVTPQFPAPAASTLPPALALLGYDLPLASLSPGETLPLTLYWQAQDRLPDDYRLSVALQSADGAIVAEARGDLAGPAFPTTAWQPGDTVRSWFDLAVPATVLPADYQLLMTVETGSLPAGRVALGQVQVAGRAREFSAPLMTHELHAGLGEQITLRGYDLDLALARPGGSLDLTLYWQAQSEIDLSYTVFVHLLDEDGKVVAQVDSPPGAGALPTTGWLPGEYVTDRYSLALPGSLPAGTYRLEIGIYDPASMARLPVLWPDSRPSEDRVLLPELINVDRGMNHP